MSCGKDKAKGKGRCGPRVHHMHGTPGVEAYRNITQSSFVSDTDLAEDNLENVAKVLLPLLEN